MIIELKLLYENAYNLCVTEYINNLQYSVP